MSSSL
ncbi:51d3cc51-4e42-4603-9e97-19558922d7c3 [Thermothielavioides terrestris]|jgi:hypothetical protein